MLYRCFLPAPREASCCTPQDRQYPHFSLHLVHGDITQAHADALVTAANESLRGGRGVDGVVHRAAGRKLKQATQPYAPLRPGDAIRTPAFKLAPQVGCIIHAVGPRYKAAKAQGPALLQRAYTSALEQAEAAGCLSVALPSLSTGAYGFPPQVAAPVALRAVHLFLATQPRALRDITFVLFDACTFAHFAQAMQEPCDDA